MRFPGSRRNLPKEQQRYGIELDFVYMPKFGNQPNVAEADISLMTSQCRVVDFDALQEETV